ncbi:MULTISPECIES: GNAT family N-acetyltransferase [unclassified Microbacterium]|uniref:GNAT family N-acetyltransferase n=1 Tax=unclassified Microbacterium TaxID=2609290 RepID=UPI0013858B64|nr:GNAT family N-acetyltransferase [Microbacterium sp. MAH-37]
MSGVLIRDYRDADAAATLRVFIDAVTVTAAEDYSPEQIAAWARPEKRGLADWSAAMHRLAGIVAVVDGQVAGFSDVNAAGYIDMMFVSPSFARRGLARALLTELETRARDAGATGLSSNVSITARPFFEHAGFVVEAEQHPVIDGIELTNFRMTKALG